MADEIDIILREAERLSSAARDLAWSRASATGRDDYEQMQALRASPYASRIPSATPTVQELREAQELVAGPQTLGTGMAAGGAARGALDFAVRLGNEPFRLLEQAANLANVERATTEGFGANLDAARAVRFERDPLSNAPREFFEEIKFPFPGAAGVAADVVNPLDPFGPVGDVVSTIGLGIPFLRLAKRYLPDAADTIERGAVRASTNEVEPIQNVIGMFEELSNNYIGDEGVQFEFFRYGEADNVIRQVLNVDSIREDVIPTNWDFELIAKDIDNGVDMIVSSAWDTNGNPVLYIDSLSSDAAMRGERSSIRASAVVNSILEVADAAGIPVYAEPSAYSRLSSLPPMSTRELSAMYNRLGFEPPSKSTPRVYVNGQELRAFVRNSMPLDPEARASEYARRLRPELTQESTKPRRSLAEPNSNEALEMMDPDDMLDMWIAEDYVPELNQLTSDEIDALLEHAARGGSGHNAFDVVEALRSPSVSWND